MRQSVAVSNPVVQYLKGVAVMQIGITVGELLENKVFNNSQILGGRDGLDKLVDSITVAELPDSLDWFQGGELVCSTAYILKGDQDALCRWIDGMVERKVSALAIKPERFLGSLPQQVIDKADRYGFPIIAVPLDVTWPSVINGVMNLVMEHKLTALHSSEDVYSHLTQLALDSQGMVNMVNAIGKLVKYPVILEDCCLNVLAYYIPGDDKANDDRLTLDYRLSTAYTQQLLRTPFVTNTLFSHQKTTLRDILVTPAGSVEQIILPLIAGQDVFGFLTVLLKDKKVGDQDLVTLKHGSDVIALEFLKEKTALEAVGRSHVDLLNHVLDCEHISEEELKRKAALLGINVTQPTCVMIIDFKMSKLPRIVGQAECEDEGESPMPVIPYWLVPWVVQMIQTTDTSSRVFRYDGKIVAFFTPSGNHSGRNLVQKAKILGDNIVQGLAGIHPNIDVFIGIGRPYTEPRKIQQSYQEARTVVSIRPFLEESMGRVVTFSEIGIYRFLSVINNPDELDNFQQDIIGKLVEYDQRHGTNLFTTLETYFCCNENQADTARRLFVHVNSLNYRLQRIEEILEVDLHNAETRVLLYLAIVLHKSEKKRPHVDTLSQTGRLSCQSALPPCRGVSLWV
jgi:purine catabolism regulator